VKAPLKEELKMIYCNMSEALKLWLNAVKPDIGGEWSLYDAFCVKMDHAQYELAANIKRVFRNDVRRRFSGVVVYGGGAKSIARHYARERYLDGLVDEIFEPERKGNGYYIPLC
jgi:hypothetical protein